MSRRYSPSPDNRRYRSPPRDRYRSPPRRSRRDSSQYKDTGCLFIGNIPYEFTEKDLRDLFHKMGEIESVTVGMNHKTGQPKGHAFVQFYNPESAKDTYYKFNDLVIDKRPLHIDWDAGRRNKMKTNRYRRGPYDRPRNYRRRSPSYSPMRPRYSRSPPRRRRYSRSPPRRRRESFSPRGSRSPPPPRRFSRSPPRHSRSPVPREPISPKDRSPMRTPPPRQSRSPMRRDSLSPVRGNAPFNSPGTDRAPVPQSNSPPRE